jgi:hypothetical protein
MTKGTCLPKTWKRAKGAARGAAMVEAVVVLPVLIILFVSVFYVRNQVLARQAAESKARMCAWAFSMSNCDMDRVPAGCEGFVGVVSAGGPLGDRVNGELSNATYGIAGPIVEVVLKPVLVAAFGQALDAKTDVSYERPGLYGGGTQSAHGGYHLACNLTPETLPDVAMDAWHALSSKF